MTAGWRRWLRVFARDAESDVDAELRFHMEARVEDLVARGSNAADARAQALAEFGDVDATRERLGAIDRRIAEKHRRADWWEGIAQDLRHTLRGLARSPGFTVMVVVTLALGIGANAAVFSVLDRLFLATPAGVEHPTELRRLLSHGHFGGNGRAYSRTVFSWPLYRDLTAAAGAIPMTAYYDQQEHLGRGPGAPTATVTSVLGDYFGVLRVRITHGRGFRPEEVTMGTPVPVAVISDAMWRTRFGASANVVGDSLMLGVHKFTIVGVAPPGFRGLGLDGADLWVPLNTDGSWRPKAFHQYDTPYTGFLWPVARISTAAEEGRLAVAATAVLRHDPSVRDSTAVPDLASINAGLTAFYDREGTIVTRLAGVAAIILLLACANVANLMLARAARRRREIGVRVALGVSRRRLLAQLLAESVLLAATAGAAALLLAIWSGALLRATLIPEVRWATPTLNGVIVGFTGVVTLLATAAAGLIPALQASHPDLTTALKAGGSGGTPRSRTRTALVIAQVGITVVLLAGAGLFVRSLQSVKAVDVGYDTDGMIIASAHYDVDAGPVGGDQRAVLLPQIAERLRRVPGVLAVGLAANAPMQAISFTDLFLPDRDSIPKLNGTPPLSQVVAPGFFRASGIRLLAGRTFRDGDREGAEPVLVVSNLMAKTFWPSESAIGKCVILDKRGTACRRVVGVVSDEHVIGFLDSPAMQIFIPLAQAPGSPGAGQIIVRGAPDRVSFVEQQARHMLVEAFGSGAIPDVRVMRDVLAPQLRPWRLGALLFSFAGFLALLVASVGIYSAISYGVNQRTREIGIRMALGARGASVARLIVGQGVRVVLVGIAIGVVAALAAGRLVASLLYGVTPHDPLVLVTTAATLVVVAVVACLIPARRAARVDPMETLRAE